jgi:hypothetical protein
VSDELTIEGISLLVLITDGLRRLTLAGTASGPHAAFWVHPHKPQGRDAVARDVKCT